MGSSGSETPTTRGWQLFFRHCRSAAAREIQVATGLPITPCQRRVWLTACEPERVGPVRDAMRLGRVERRLGRALAKVINPDIPLPGRLNMFDEMGWAQALAPTTPQARQHTWATARSGQNQLILATAAANRDAPPPF